MKHEVKQAHTTMIVSTFLVATSFPVVAAVAGALDSAVLTLLRFGLASLLFLPLVAARHGRETIPSGRSLVRYAVLSAPLVGFFFAMFEALRTTTPVNTAALFTLGPSFAALFAFLCLRERLAPRQLVALLIATLGAMWVVLRGDPSRILSLDFVVGDAYFLAGTALLGLYSTLVKRLHRCEPMEVMTFWTLVTGTGWLLLSRWSELSSIRWDAIELQTIIAIGYLAVFATLITFLLGQRAVVVIGPTRMMAYAYLNPALVGLATWVLGDGAVGWAAVPGIALTLAAMISLQRHTSPADAAIPCLLHPHPKGAV